MLFEVSAKAILSLRGRVLVLRRRSSRGDYFWDLPGGRLSRVAPVVEELARELREELGSEITIASCVPVATDVWHDSPRTATPKVLIYFHVELAAWPKEIVLSAEHDAWVLIGPLELDAEIIGGARVEPALRALLRDQLLRGL